jgi:UPF0271 protein
MRRVCAQAVAHGVAIGAQVGYRDLAGFGRRRIDYAPDELRDDLLYQLAALDGFARVAGSRVRYVKPHGALYSTAGSDEAQAGAVLDAVREYDATLPVLGLPGSVLLRLAEQRGMRAVAEGFVDRGYQPSGALVPRGRHGAMVTDVDFVVRRALRMARDGTVLAVDGSEITCRVRSLCVHGDTPGAVDLARAVRAALEAEGIAVAPFT